MSAYQVSGEHIAYLLAVALESGGHHGPFRVFRTRTMGDCMIPGQDDEELFAILAGENAASVGYRYEEDLAPVPFVRPPHSRIAIRTLADVAAAMKAIDGYEYQSCEHPQWEHSHAASFCTQLRRQLVKCIPGFRAAADKARTWHVTSIEEAIAAK